MFGKQSYVVLLYMLPDCILLRVGIEAAAQVLFAFVNALVIERDPFSRYALKFLPIAGLEQCLGISAGLTEQPIVAIEPIEHALRDQVGEFGLRCRSSCRHVRSRSRL
jgi:hypothetical protein